MSQRKALIASLVITLVLALSAIGIRAAMVDSPDALPPAESVLTLVEPGGGDFDDDDRFEGSDGDAFEYDDEDSDDDEREEDEDEDDDDVDER